QPMLVQMNSFAPAINLAGRQRMLSQRLTKAALALQAAGDEARRQHYQAELRTTLEQWTAAHLALRQVRQLTSPEFDQAWRDLQPAFEAMLAAGGALAGLPVTVPTETSATTIGLSSNVSAASPDNVMIIVDHEATYLSSMEKIVALLEHDAKAQVTLLRDI